MHWNLFSSNTQNTMTFQLILSQFREVKWFLFGWIIYLGIQNIAEHVRLNESYHKLKLDWNIIRQQALRVYWEGCRIEYCKQLREIKYQTYPVITIAGINSKNFPSFFFRRLKKALCPHGFQAFFYPFQQCVDHDEHFLDNVFDGWRSLTRYSWTNFDSVFSRRRV